ncbi:hypothetical protein Hanom_Chr03g00202721 [Helianthus anomalus]
MLFRTFFSFKVGYFFKGMLPFFMCLQETCIEGIPYLLDAVCFFCKKRSAVCGSYLQTSVGEEVEQMSAVCKEKRVCFFISIKTSSHT